MSDLNEPREIIFETGQVAFAAPGNSFELQDADGKVIPITSERVMTKDEVVERESEIMEPGKLVGEQVDGEWQVRAKTDDELKVAD